MRLASVVSKFEFSRDTVVVVAFCFNWMARKSFSALLRIAINSLLFLMVSSKPPTFGGNESTDLKDVLVG